MTDKEMKAILNSFDKSLGENGLAKGEFTTAMFAKAAGMSITNASNRVATLRQAGKVVPVGRKRILGDLGEYNNVHVWRKAK